MTPPDRLGDSDDDPSAAIIDLTDPAITSIGRVVDLRTPGAPYTYPSSPSRSDDADPEPAPDDAGLFGVARGSAHVPTAPPDYA